MIPVGRDDIRQARFAKIMIRPDHGFGRGQERQNKGPSFGAEAPPGFRLFLRAFFPMLARICRITLVFAVLPGWSPRSFSLPFGSRRRAVRRHSRSPVSTKTSACSASG